MQNYNSRGQHVTWREADKSGLKAKGRSIRAMLDSTRREDGKGRYIAATITTLVIASVVGLSGVFAGPAGTGSDILTSSLSPLSGIVERVTGASPASAQAAPAHPEEDCGTFAADVAGSSNAGADAEVDASVDTLIVDILPPIGPGIIPIDIPTNPPIGDPDDDDDDDDNDDPSDDDDDDDDPNPPSDDDDDDEPTGSSSNLIGADVNVLGNDVLDLSILPGNLLKVNADALNPSGTGTNSTIEVLDANGNQLVGVGVDPQSDDIVDLEINGDDVLDGIGGVDLLDDLTGDVLGGDGNNLLEEVVDTVEELLGGDVLGGDVLGGDSGGGLLGGLLN